MPFPDHLSMLPSGLIQPTFLPPTGLYGNVPKVGFVSHLVRLARLLWTVWVGLPLALVGCWLLACGIPALPRVEGRSLALTFFIYVVSSLIWAGSWGHVPRTQSHDLPFDEPPLVAESAPLLSAWLFGRTDRRGRKMCSQGVILPPASRKVCVGMLADGFGTVVRKEVQATWLYREGEEGPSMGHRASEGERLIIYFVGGGYVSGTSLIGPFPYSLLDFSPSKTRLLGVQYRHAIHKECCFPGALQDALAAWIFAVTICRFDPQDIVLCGDSAGAGLSWSLAAYLGVVQPSHALGTPGKVALFSPWLDLSLSHPGVGRNAPQDILNVPQISTASDCYLFNVLSLPPYTPISSSYVCRIPLDLLDNVSFQHLQAGHPLFSPAALALVSSTSSTTEAPLLSLLLDGLKSTKFFVHYASAEVFTSESEFFVSLLRAAGVQVDSVVEVGGWHCCQTIFPPLESDSVLARWFGLGQRERRACETFAKFIKTG